MKKGREWDLLSLSLFQQTNSHKAKRELCVSQTGVSIENVSLWTIPCSEAHAQWAPYRGHWIAREKPQLTAGSITSQTQDKASTRITHTHRHAHTQMHGKQTSKLMNLAISSIVTRLVLQLLSADTPFVVSQAFTKHRIFVSVGAWTVQSACSSCLSNQQIPVWLVWCCCSRLFFRTVVALICRRYHMTTSVFNWVGSSFAACSMFLYFMILFSWTFGCGLYISIHIATNKVSLPSFSGKLKLHVGLQHKQF